MKKKKTPQKYKDINCQTKQTQTLRQFCVVHVQHDEVNEKVQFANI